MELLDLMTASCTSRAKKNNGSNEESVRIRHILDTVAVPAHPRRVVVLGAGPLENMGLMDAHIAGISKTGLPHYLSAYKNDPSIADVGNFEDVKVRKITQLQPDLILLGEGFIDHYDEIDEIAPTIISRWDRDHPMKALQKNLNDLSSIFGREDIFDQAFDKLHKKIATVREEIRSSDQKSLVVLYDGNQFSIAGSDPSFAFIYDILGVTKATENLDVYLQFYDRQRFNEFIRQVNPDILFMLQAVSTVGEKPLHRNDRVYELIGHTDDSKSGKVVSLNPDVWYRLGAGIRSLNMMVDEIAYAYSSNPMFQSQINA